MTQSYDTAMTNTVTFGR